MTIALPSPARAPMITLRLSATANPTQEEPQKKTFSDASSPHWQQRDQSRPAEMTRASGAALFFVGMSIGFALNSVLVSQAVVAMGSTARMSLETARASRDANNASDRGEPWPSSSLRDLSMFSQQLMQLLDASSRTNVSTTVDLQRQLKAVTQQLSAFNKTVQQLTFDSSRRVGSAPSFTNKTSPASNPAPSLHEKRPTAGPAAQASSPVAQTSAAATSVPPTAKSRDVQKFTAQTLSSFLQNSAQFSMRRGKCKHIHTIRPHHKQPRDPLTHVCLDAVENKKKRGEPCYVVSIGIDNVWIFDDLMLSQGCTVYSLDPSMGPNTNNRYTRHPVRHKFFAQGIGVSDGLGRPQTQFQRGYRIPSSFNTVSLTSLMKQMGTSKLDVVRMDCEGAEWTVLEAWLAAGLLDSIEQLLLEVHMDSGHLQQQMETISRVLAHDNVMWSARNTYSPHALPGTPLTPVWELGLWSKASSYFGSLRRRL